MIRLTRTVTQANYLIQSYVSWQSKCVIDVQESLWYLPKK